MNFFGRAFSESSGKPSSSRLITAGSTVLILGCWAAVSIHRWELQPISPELAAVVLGSMASKSWQRGKEDGGHRSEVKGQPEAQANK